MIRKLLLCSALFLIGSGASMAADSEKDSYFGIKAGIDMNLPGKWHYDDGSVKMYRHGYGFNLGGVYNAWLGKGFFLEPGVSLYYDSYSYYELYVSDGVSTTVFDKDPRVYKIGLRIPVVVGYEFGITERYSMNIFTGPELNYSFAGNIVGKNKELWGDLTDTLFEMQRRVDCAWKIGLGFPVNHFMLGIDAAVGMTDLQKGSISFRENRLTLAGTYYF